MNLEFYSAHTATLKDLFELADRHNCTITFGCSSWPLDDIDDDFLKENFNCPKQVAADIVEKMDIYCESGMYSDIWFDLYDKTKEKHNRLTYQEGSVLVRLEQGIYDDEISDGTREWLEDNEPDAFVDSSNKYFLSDNFSHEHVFGFEGITKEWNCYRPGIVLAVFTQLVCDYLNEPRIVRTY